MHSISHNTTCFKYGHTKCRANFPRTLVPHSLIHLDTGVIQIQRDDQWLNSYNPLLSMLMRANHDIQVFLTKDHILASIYYVIKYISKPEATLHSKLTIAAAARKAMSDSNNATDISAKKMLLKVCNKIESHREVGVPEAISHLLNFPDHYTDTPFKRLNTTHLWHHIRSQWPNSDENHDDEIDDQCQIISVDHAFKLVSLFDDYGCRGQSLDNFCLYDYFSIFYKRKCHNGIPFAAPHPQLLTHTQFARETEARVPALIGNILFVKPDSTDEDVREEYYCILTGLFLPWHAGIPIRPADVTWEAHYHQLSHTISPRLRRYIENLKNLHKSHDESIIDRLQQAARGISQWDEIVPDIAAQDDVIFSVDNDTALSHAFLVEHAILLSTIHIDISVVEAIDANHNNGYFRSISSLTLEPIQ